MLSPGTREKAPLPAHRERGWGEGFWRLRVRAHVGVRAYVRLRPHTRSFAPSRMTRVEKRHPGRCKGPRYTASLARLTLLTGDAVVVRVQVIDVLLPRSPILDKVGIRLIRPVEIGAVGVDAILAVDAALA